ncbi:hypothetical protein K501DRAFT_247190 [Backusella circina FSU 941]|nr:hypothetical protein K501DRAFT_247190 [Backusella circina FSU 941]
MNQKYTKPAMTGIQSSDGLQKHIEFWDKNQKGYITPIDTINGFMTLGYGVMFSVLLGSMTSIFLSLTCQDRWIPIPDPLCRSDIKHLIQSKKASFKNRGAYNDEGDFVPDKFNILFEKYARSDKTGATISLPELIRMTQEQESLGFNMNIKEFKGWLQGIIELSAAYFFIGHRGHLKREDVKAAYDGSLFYKLQNAKGVQEIQVETNDALSGTYLCGSNSDLTDNKFSLYDLASIDLRKVLSFAKEQTHEFSLENILRRHTSIQGVRSPKLSFFSREVAPIHDQSKLFPHGMTGVAKNDQETSPEVPSLTGLSNSSVQQSDSVFDSLVGEPSSFTSSSFFVSEDTESKSILTGVATPEIDDIKETSTEEDDNDVGLTGVSKETESGEKGTSPLLIPKSGITPPPEEASDQEVSENEQKKNQQENKDTSDFVSPASSKRSKKKNNSKHVAPPVLENSFAPIATDVK